MGSMATPTVYTANTTDTFRQAIGRINADIAGSYAINITGSLASTTVTFATNADKTIIVEGDSTNRSIYNDGSNALFTIPGGITLVLGNNITLNGNNKVTPAVIIEAGGVLTMNSGSTITGARLRGVYMDGGTFTMAGGTISGNSAKSNSFYDTYGGGVRVGDGSFFKTGGTIDATNSAQAGASSVCQRLQKA
jgi:acetyltransferase-like isoleucine patch superfamily enzyme